LRPIGIIAVTALLVVGCSRIETGTVHSPIPVTSPTPSVNPADSKAADLRTRIDLLLGEQVMVVAKQAIAASNHTDEYAGYATLLTTNANSLVDLMRSAYGNSAASQFDQAWRIQTGYLIDYTIGLVTHNEAKSNGAKSGLANVFVPEFAQLITSLTQLPVDQIKQIETQHVTETQAVIDDVVASAYTKMYPDLRTAYASSSRIGDILAIRIVQQFPDKFPGDPSNKSVEARVLLNNLLQEHSYLATMTTNAAVSNRTDEQSAAAASLGANAAALGKWFTELFGSGAATQVEQLWGARNADLIAYATSGDASARQGLAAKFATHFYGLAPLAVDPARDQLIATIKVVDDQRAKAFKAVAGDDRTAAAGMQAVADRIA
jgi:hypothetical protein